MILEINRIKLKMLWKQLERDNQKMIDIDWSSISENNKNSIDIWNKIIFWKRFPLNKYLVTKFKGVHTPGILECSTQTHSLRKPTLLMKTLDLKKLIFLKCQFRRALK